MGLPGMLSLFYDTATVTKYSPAVIDAFVKQTKVSPSPAPHPLALNVSVFTALGETPLDSRQRRDLELSPRALRQRPLFTWEWVSIPARSFTRPFPFGHYG
jgi:hypothetical protein